METLGWVVTLVVVSMLPRFRRGDFKVHLGALGMAEAFAQVSAKPGVSISPLAWGFCFGRVESKLWGSYHVHTKILNHRDSVVKFNPFFLQIHLYKVCRCAGWGGHGFYHPRANSMAGNKPGQSFCPHGGACGHGEGQWWPHSEIPNLIPSLWRHSLTSLPSSKFLFIPIFFVAVGPG